MNAPFFNRYQTVLFQNWVTAIFKFVKYFSVALFRLVVRIPEAKVLLLYRTVKARLIKIEGKAMMIFKGVRLGSPFSCSVERPCLFNGLASLMAL